MQDDNLRASKLIWLASYPKSGNTWLRAILKEAVAAPQGLMKAIRSATKSMPENVPFHDVMGTKAKIVKTHCYPSSPRLCGVHDEVIGIITIQRHLLDVLLSSLNYFGVSDKPRSFLNGEIDQYIDRFTKHDGWVEFQNLCGPWSKYGARWHTEAKRINVPHLSVCGRR